MKRKAINPSPPTKTDRHHTCTPSPKRKKKWTSVFLEAKFPLAPCVNWRGNPKSVAGELPLLWPPSTAGRPREWPSLSISFFHTSSSKRKTAFGVTVPFFDTVGEAGPRRFPFHAKQKTASESLLLQLRSCLRMLHRAVLNAKLLKLSGQVSDGRRTGSPVPAAANNMQTVASQGIYLLRLTSPFSFYSAGKHNI